MLVREPFCMLNKMHRILTVRGLNLLEGGCGVLGGESFIKISQQMSESQDISFFIDDRHA